MKELLLHDTNISYLLKRSRRAKYLRVAIHAAEKIVVTAPYWAREVTIEKFLLDKVDWINRAVAHFKKNTTALVADSFLASKWTAEAFIKNKLEFFNGFYGLEFKRICIKNHKRKWGSCSAKGNLNFNYRLLFLPEYLADYVVVHELCHLKELNHSPKFWHLVARQIPDYLERRRRLRNVIFNR